MRIWTQLIEQKIVYHIKYGFGVAVSRSNDGLLFIHFDSNPWNPKRMAEKEVKIR